MHFYNLQVMPMKKATILPAPCSDNENRAAGCLMGQLAGDALGSLVEFRSAKAICRLYPDGPRALVAGGVWNTLAGQPTDDSEMALLLARLLADAETYDADAARERYVYWLKSRPFDCGNTIRSALRGDANEDSQANGALMRVSPLGIFMAGKDWELAASAAMRDAAITHPNPVCTQANALYVCLIAHAVAYGGSGPELYRLLPDWLDRLQAHPSLRAAVERAEHQPPADFMSHQGWVLIALQNALWQLVHAASFEDGVVDTVRRGGDTDTNAAICGALLGAVHGWNAIPEQWREAVLTCRPKAGKRGVMNPRPECFWPVDAYELALRLLDSRIRRRDRFVWDSISSEGLILHKTDGSSFVFRDGSWSGPEEDTDSTH